MNRLSAFTLAIIIIIISVFQPHINHITEKKLDVLQEAFIAQHEINNDILKHLAALQTITRAHAAQLVQLQASTVIEEPGYLVIE